MAAKGPDETPDTAAGFAANGLPRWRLRTLLVGLIVAVLAPLVMMRLVAVDVAISQGREQAEAGLVATADALANAVDREIGLYDAMLQAFVTSPVFGANPAEPDLPALYVQAARLARQSGITINVYHPDGRILLSTQRPLGARLPAANATELINRVVATGQPAVGGLVLGAITGQFEFGVGVPVPGPDGGVALVVAVSLKAAGLRDLLAAQHLPAGEVAGVLDSQHLVVASTYAQADTTINRPVPPGNASHYASMQQGLFRAPALDGDMRAFGFHAVADAPGWTVVASEPTSLLDASWVRPLLTTAAGGALALGIAIVLALLVARRILAPLHRLGAQARIIAATASAAPRQDRFSDLGPVPIIELEELRRAFMAAEQALRRRAEAEQEAAAALAARDAELRALHDASPIGILTVETTGRVLATNDVFPRMLGMTTADVLAGIWRWDAMTAPESRGRTERAIAEAIASPDHTCRPYEKELMRPDGTRLPVLSSLALLALPGADGTPGRAAVFVMDLSEIQRSQAKLSESEERYRTLADATHEAVLIHEDGRIAEVNEACRRMLGMASREALVGRHVTEFLAPECREASIARIRDASTEPYESIGLRIDDSAFPIEIQGHRLRFQGRPMRVSVVRDLTRQKASDAALRANEARVRGLLDTVADGIILADEAGRIVSANPASLRIFGYAAETDLLGRNLAILMTPDDAATHDAHLDAHRTTGPSRAIGQPGRELTGLRCDGTQFPIDLTVSSFRSGSARYFTGVLRDVTERKKAEQALRSSESRWRGLAEALPQLVWTCRADGTCDYLNPNWTAFTGTPAEQHLGFGWVEAVHPDERARLLAAWSRAQETAEPLDIETRLRGADGTYRWFKERAVPLCGPDGAVLQWFGTSTDISDLVAAREAMAREADELERLVAQRTRELHDSQMKLAQAARLEALGRLAGGVAHDFNNILQAVQGGVTLASRRMATDPDQARALLDRVELTTQRGAAITGRLLTFARRGELVATPVDPVALLHGLVAMLAPTMAPGVVLHVDAAPDLPRLLADAGQLETVLVNLVSNARDALPEMGGTIHLAATVAGPAASLPAGAYLRLSVIDDGMGMSHDVRARVTEPFFTTKPVGKGTGLGLPMAAGFAEQSGGLLSIESVPGRGTTVSIFLPVASDMPVAPDMEEADLDEADSEPAGPEYAAIRTTVMVVDDQAEIRRLLAALIGDAGHAVTEAGDGPAALACLDGGMAPDILVTDFSMPGGMDGLALLREARRRIPGLPAVLITGNVEASPPVALAEAAAGGPFIALRKPVSARNLLACITQMLRAATTEA